MWIKTVYGELINTDRLFMIRYDTTMNRTMGFSNRNQVIISTGDYTETIMNGLMRNSAVLEVK